MADALPTVEIGPDQVCVHEDRLVVHAAQPMDWPIRAFCKVPIYFRGARFYVCSERKAERPFAMVYELRPWPADLHESSTDSVVYDEAYVADRDRASACGRRHQRLYLALLPAYPFLGLFWSGFKNRILGRLGFEPGAITKASITLVFNLFFLEMVFVGFLKGGGLVYLSGQAALRTLDWVLVLVLGLDSALRFGQSLRLDVQNHWGFCEWLWPGRR